ncbi:MAG: PstS family phosphate ABC transporter substrate-binding protein [Candidatus Obscuribacterales bacterium]|jgi:phosphate transport system substrate-binding protein
MKSINWHPRKLILDKILAAACGVSFVLAGCTSAPTTAPRDTSSIVVQGSDTMEGLMQMWANDYMATKPGLQIAVKQGDTGSGIDDLLSGKIDLAAASREISETENKTAHSKGVHLKRLMVARDAIAIVVNPQNKLDEIDLGDLAKIYLGETSTWKQIRKDLAAEPIRAFGRESTSGTSDYFQEHVLSGKAVAPVVKVMPSSEALIGAVMGNRLAIGFVGMAQATSTDKVKVLKLKLTEKSPDSKQGGALSGSDYPLSRPLYVYYNQANEERVGKFVGFCLTDDGQKSVKALGFMPAH